MARAAKVHATRAEILQLARTWDERGCLALFDVQSVRRDEAVGVFAVPKDADYDRLILNPTVVNGRMATVSEQTRTLAPGSMLCLIGLRPNERLRFSSDDLREYYYTFIVSEARAKRNSLAMQFEAAELSHLKAFDPAKHSGRRLYIALRTLAMGDSLAVELAQEAHLHLLESVGAMTPTERVCYRAPMPRGPFFELLAIDDHVGAQVVPLAGSPQGQCRDEKVFAGADKAYQRAGLIQHPGKRRRGVDAGVFLGCEIDGRAGFACDPRPRVVILAALTSLVAKQGCCTLDLLSTLLGCWIHVLMYRRPALCVLDSVFRASQDLPKHQVFELPNDCRNELLCLAAIACTLVTDLRADYCEDLFALDASPFASGICRAHVGSVATRELWRHCEQRGFYTRLESPATALLREIGCDPGPLLLSEDPGQQFPASFQCRIPRALSEGYVWDCIEIFRGEGSWSTAHEFAGLSVHDGVDVQGRRLRYLDMGDSSAFRELVALALRGVIRDWHAGPPCLTYGTYGTLRRPRVRSKLQPFGFDPLDPLTALHNTLPFAPGS